MASSVLSADDKGWRAELGQRSLLFISEEHRAGKTVLCFLLQSLTCQLWKRKPRRETLSPTDPSVERAQFRFSAGGGARPLPVYPASQLSLKPPPGLWIHSPMALSSLFCSRKVSFIRELLLVLFVCFLISKNKEFTKNGGGQGGEGRRGEGQGRQ